MHFPRNVYHFEFGGHIRSYINYYKSETFLMPDIFIGMLQEIVLFKKIFLNQIEAILKLAAIATLKLLHFFSSFKKKLFVF